MSDKLTSWIYFYFRFPSPLLLVNIPRKTERKNMCLAVYHTFFFFVGKYYMKCRWRGGGGGLNRMRYNNIGLTVPMSLKVYTFILEQHKKKICNPNQIKKN